MPFTPSGQENGLGLFYNNSAGDPHRLFSYTMLSLTWSQAKPLMTFQCH